MNKEALFQMKIGLRSQVAAESARLYHVENIANVTFGYQGDQGFELLAIEEVLNNRDEFKAKLENLVAYIAHFDPLFWDCDQTGILEKPNNDAIDSAVKWLKTATNQHSLFSASEMLNINFDKN